MDSPIKQFFDALNAEESTFIPQLASDNLGLILRSAVNELDWYYYNLTRTDNPTRDQEEQFYLLQLGVTRLIQLSLDARPSFDVPTVMFRRTHSITIRVLEITAALGMIEHGRRIAQTVSTGLCCIERTGDNQFLITLPSVIPDDEYYERAVSQHYQAESRRWFAELLQSDSGKKVETEVNEMLAELVYAFQTHYIGYGAAPLLDLYFFSIASSEVQLYDGYDTFNYAIRFGGIRYQHYILALIYIIAIYIRHERFAEALVRKEPSVKLGNVLTISSDTEGFVESIRDAVNYFGSDVEDFEEINLEDAQRIFEVLSCSRKNTSLLSRPASPLPLIIRSSDHGFIRCLTGAHINPMQFLLNSLRHHFPGDYNKHQQSREKSMQVAIKRVLNEGFVGLNYLENIKVRLNGRVLTDIDLVVTEESTGTVFLCQIKFQELYGSDIHAKHVRTKRLKDQATSWIASLDDWIGAVGEAGVRASLRLPKNFPTLSVYRLVISRHYGYPLKDLSQNSDTAYANWIQFFNAIELIKMESPNNRKLGNLVAMLKRTEAPGGLKEHLAEPRIEWIINNLKFTVRQECDRG
jgi:hypothetical protein